MKLIVTLFLTLGISISILTYLSPDIFNGIAATLFSGELWEHTINLLATFGGFYTRILANNYILQLVGVFVVFYVLKLFVNLLISRRETAFKPTPEVAEKLKGQQKNDLPTMETGRTNDSAINEHTESSKDSFEYTAPRKTDRNKQNDERGRTNR